MGDYLPPKPLTRDRGGEWVREKVNGLNTLDSSETFSCGNYSSSSDIVISNLTCEILLKRGLVKDPSCLYEVNVSCLGLEGIESGLHSRFTSLRKIAAADNTLSLDLFKGFNELTELDLSLNQVSSLLSYSNGFECLHSLNLSFNFLKPLDIEKLGYLPSLKILYLSGNDLYRLPPDLAESGLILDGQIVFKFAKLEVLYLDDNKLSDAQDFASLASLPRLTYLNLAKNNFHTVPLLKSISSKKHQVVKAQQDSSIDDTLRFKFTTSIDDTLQSENSFINCSQQQVEYNESLVINGKQLKTSHISKSNSDHDSHLDKQNLQDSHNEMTMNKQSMETNNHLFIRKKTTHQKQHLTDTFLDEHRNPNAPRLRILDEYVGINNLRKLLHLISNKQTNYHHVNSISIESDKEENICLLQTPRSDKFTYLANEENYEKITKCIPPPFQSLQCIDLSYNKISCEEHLLPIAVWPKLKECRIYANPVVSKSSRIPPLLERLLIKQLNIELCRYPLDNHCLFGMKNDGLFKKDEFTNGYIQHLSPTYNRSIEDKQIGTVTSSSRLTKNISRYKNVIHRTNVKPVVIRHKLNKSSLNMGPKIARCNVNRILNELKMLDQRNSVSSPQISSSTTLSTSASPIKLSNLLNVSTSNDSIKYKDSMFNKSENITPSLQLPPIENYKTFIKSDSQLTEPNLTELLSYFQYDEQDEEDKDNFFTTQLSSFKTSRIEKTSKCNSHHSDTKCTNYQPQSDESCNLSKELLAMTVPLDNTNEQVNEDEAVINCSATSGLLLPYLEEIVDDENLPDSMQACLRELRYLLQHKPTIHPPIHSLLTLPGNDKFVKYSTELLPLSLSSKSIKGEKVNLAIPVSSGNSGFQSSPKDVLLSRKTLPTSTSPSMKLVPVSKPLEILPSRPSLNQFTKKFTSFTEIPLTKALKDEEIERQQFEKMKAKQNPLVYKLRKVSQLNQPKHTRPKKAKELFEQFQAIYSNTREQAIISAMNAMNQEFDRKTEQFCKNN
ncbi:X-ray radiation resistance-associated protein 1 [Schistosoma japonicum]|nr:X-ray radiation resistance-associated protein 1 [Schistosoma japonicum]